MSEATPNKVRTSPYPGCRNYDASDAEWFFGRRRERELVISHLFNSRSRLTIYYGASGVGKTSLLLADVVPVLTGQKRPPEVTDADRKRYDSSVVVVFRGWQDQHFQSALREEIFSCVLGRMNRVPKKGETIDAIALRKKIAAAFAEMGDGTEDPALAGKPDAEIRNFLLKDAPLPEFLTACCRVAGRIFLIFDQFEEYFRYFADSPEREEFDGDFATVVNSPEIPVTILVSLREDGLSKLDRLQVRIPNLFENMLRLEHLDEQGAREAIKVPLDQFNAMRSANAPGSGAVPSPIIFQQRLIDELAREVAPKASIAGGSVPPISDGGPGLRVKRYQGASYLQILLASAWREVEQHGKTELTVETLIEAARGYARSTRVDGGNAPHDESMDFATCAQQIAASYVFCIMENELEAARDKMPEADRAKIEQLGLPRMRDTAARILRYLVTPGGAKMAHTVDTLAQWANVNMDGGEAGCRDLSNEEIDLTLRLLTEAGLVRRAEVGNTIATIRYEIAHDVLATPIDKWREAHERKRASARATEKAKEDEARRIADALKAREAIDAKLRAEKWTKVALVSGSLALAAVVASGIAFWQSRRADMAFRQAQYVRSADAAMHLLENGNDLETIRIAALTSIPSVEETDDMLAPPQALVALRFATLFSGQDLSERAPEWPSTQLDFLDSYLPSLLSPDKKWLITLEGNQPYVWNTEQLYRREGKLPPVDRVISGMGFSTDSKIFFVTCADGSEVEWTLASRAQKRRPTLEARETRFVKKFPQALLSESYHTYSSIATKWTQDALPNLVEPSESVRRLLPAGTPMDRIPIAEILKAFAIGVEQRSVAKSQLLDATKKFVLMSDTAAESLLNLGIAVHLVKAANRLAGGGDLDGAKAKYQRAKNVNPALEIDPEKEARAWFNYDLYQAAVGKGYEAVVRKNPTEAVEQFERARLLRPDLWKDRSPIEEANRPVEAPGPDHSESDKP